MNNMQILGNLVKDVELRYTKNGRPNARFTVATNETIFSNGEKKQITDYIPVMTWGDQAEMASKGKKGNKIVVIGRFNSYSYESADGQKKYGNQCLAKFISVEGKSDADSSGQGSSNFDNFGSDVEEVPF